MQSSFAASPAGADERALFTFYHQGNAAKAYKIHDLEKVAIMGNRDIDDSKPFQVGLPRKTNGNWKNL